MKDKFKPENLPDDPKILKEIIAEMAAKIEAQDRQIGTLKSYINKIIRIQYGPKSERMQEGQGFFDFMGTLEDEKHEVKDPPEIKARRRRSSGRRVIPKELPRRTIELDIPEEEKSCGDCHGELTQFGKDVSEQLDYTPASFFVNRFVRKKYACKPCQGSLKVADPPLVPIEKGLPSAGLLSHILISKYCDHLPLYRQAGMYKRHGVDLSRSTLGDWVGRSVELLEPIYTEMKKDVLFSKVLQTDDTPLRLLVPGLGKTRQARFWGYLGDANHHQIVYEFTPDRKQKWPLDFLKDYRGYVQCDAYTGYDQLFEAGDRIEVGCWAHARRKFYESLPTDQERSRTAMAMIGRLYGVEKEARGLSPPKRRSLRQKHSQPVLGNIKGFLEKELTRSLPKSDFGKAVRYAYNQWPALARYTEDGDLQIDNNACERSLRGVAIGRKNWLFAGSERGGYWAAVIYSFVESCKMNGVEPFAYFRDILLRVSITPMSRIKSLMPRNWADNA